MSQTIKRPIDPPADLSEHSQALWRRIVVGHMSPGRRELITEGLRTLDRLRQIRAELADSPLTIRTERTKALHIHPLLKSEAEVRRQFVSIWTALNLEWRQDIDGRINLSASVMHDDE